MSLFYTHTCYSICVYTHAFLACISAVNRGVIVFGLRKLTEKSNHLDKYYLFLARYYNRIGGGQTLPKGRSGYVPHREPTFAT